MDIRPAPLSLTIALALVSLFICPYFTQCSCWQLSSWRFRVHEPTPATVLAALNLFAAVQLVLNLSIGRVSLQDALEWASLHGVVYLLSLAAFTVEYRMSARHPLASIPGPRLAKVTKWFMAYYVLKGNRHLELQRYGSYLCFCTVTDDCLHRLHTTHGPWVRIGACATV